MKKILLIVLATLVTAFPGCDLFADTISVAGGAGINKPRLEISETTRNNKWISSPTGKIRQFLGK